MLKTLFVVEDDSVLDSVGSGAISFETYLREYPKKDEPKIRIINLCDTSRYLSQGYYCSLLAEARKHLVLPSIKTINELREDGANLWLANSSYGKHLIEDDFVHPVVICMGEVLETRHRKLANRVFQTYSTPIIVVNLSREGTGIRAHIKRVSLSQLEGDARTFCVDTLQNYSKKSWRSPVESKKYRWDMAILLDPQEVVPPSNKGAISRFIKAGEKLGIRVKTITANDFNELGEFDALFIRETTAIDHHTYRFARRAESLGLVVMDDTNAILRCCNKVFLTDAFTYNNVPSLPSHIIADIEPATLDMLEQTLAYPIVLKLPEGSFSRGVRKAKDRQELIEVASGMLTESALVLAQKFLYTEFDWRIGVLNGRALYACRYYMAKHHWQIYNHSSKRNFTGGFDAVPTFEVPTAVLNAAMKAAALVGNELYGIDIKEEGGKAYVLEVNDNPSLDHGVEDAYLGEELYMQIMAEFLRRLEQRGR